MLNLILAEGHPIIRNGIRVLLEADQEINIIGEALNGLEVLDMIEAGDEADVILTDINMPKVDGISLIRQLKISHPEMQVVILSMLDDDKSISQAFAAGASGYLLKNISAQELVFSLKHVHSGAKYICSELAVRFLDKILYQIPPDYPALGLVFSTREIEVLQLVAEGLTNSEMSEKLFISKRTIEGHRQSLIEKIGVKNTAALIKYAVLNGIIR